VVDEDGRGEAVRTAVSAQAQLVSMPDPFSARRALTSEPVAGLIVVVGARTLSLRSLCVYAAAELPGLPIIAVRDPRVPDDRSLMAVVTEVIDNGPPSDITERLASVCDAFIADEVTAIVPQRPIAMPQPRPPATPKAIPAPVVTPAPPRPAPQVALTPTTPTMTTASSPPIGVHRGVGVSRAEDVVLNYLAQDVTNPRGRQPAPAAPPAQPTPPRRPVSQPAVPIVPAPIAGGPGPVVPGPIVPAPVVPAPVVPAPVVPAPVVPAPVLPTPAMPARAKAAPASLAGSPSSSARADLMPPPAAGAPAPSMNESFPPSALSTWPNLSAVSATALSSAAIASAVAAPPAAAGTPRAAAPTALASTPPTSTTRITAAASSELFLTEESNDETDGDTIAETHVGISAGSSSESEEDRESFVEPGAAMLVRLAASRRSGRLLVIEGEGAGAIHFYGGVPIGAELPTGDGGLYRRLLSLGLVSASVAPPVVRQGQLLKALVGAGALTEAQRTTFERGVLRDAVLAIARQVRISAVFVASQPGQPPPIVPPLNVFGLVLEARRKSTASEVLAAMSVELAAWRIDGTELLRQAAALVAPFCRQQDVVALFTTTSAGRLEDALGWDSASVAVFLLAMRDAGLIDIRDRHAVERANRAASPRALLGLDLDADEDEIEAAYAVHITRVEEELAAAAPEQRATLRAKREQLDVARQALRLQLGFVTGGHTNPF
jgi:hypothetical protein